MSNLEELAFLDASAQAELVQKKEVKAIELLEAAIERIERVNPELNAVITPMYDLARDAAMGEIPAGPFSGVPFLIKDLFAEYAGVRYTEGCAFLKDFIPDQDSELVVRLKKAGLIICGKTNTCEWGALPTTEPLLFCSGTARAATSGVNSPTEIAYPCPRMVARSSFNLVASVIVRGVMDSRPLVTKPLTVSEGR